MLLGDKRWCLTIPAESCWAKKSVYCLQLSESNPSEIPNPTVSSPQSQVLKALTINEEFHPLWLFKHSQIQHSNKCRPAKLSFVAVPFFEDLQKCMQSHKVLESHTKKLLSSLWKSFHKRSGTSVELQAIKTLISPLTDRSKEPINKILRKLHSSLQDHSTFLLPAS